MAGIFRGVRDQQDAFDLESNVLTNSSISSSLILHTSIAQFIVVYSLTPANMANNKMTSLVTFLLVALAVHTVAGDTAFDWGRPCTLTTAASKTEIQSSCTDCGSGATATPDATCGFNPITIPATGTIDFSYHSSVHNLYVGDAPCAFTTQICPAEDASMISPSAPCKYTPGKPGTYYISDMEMNYCSAFDAHLEVTAT